MYQDFESDPKVVRLVLKEGVTRRDVIRHAASRRWPAVGSHDAEPGRLFQYVWRSEGGEVTVFYLEDDNFGYAYLEFEGGDIGALEREVEAAVSDVGLIPVFTEAEVRACFEQSCTPLEKERAVYLLSLAGPRRCDAGWMGYYEEALADPSPDVRYAGLWAMSQAGWPEFLPLLRRLADEDPNAEVRAMAVNLTAKFQRKYGELVA